MMNLWMSGCAQECMDVYMCQRRYECIHMHIYVCVQVDNVLNKTCACMYGVAQIELTSVMI